MIVDQINADLVVLLEAAAALNSAALRLRMVHVPVRLDVLKDGRVVVPVVGKED